MWSSNSVSSIQSIRSLIIFMSTAYVTTTTTILVSVVFFLMNSVLWKNPLEVHLSWLVLSYVPPSGLYKLFRNFILLGVLSNCFVLLKIISEFIAGMSRIRKKNCKGSPRSYYSLGWIWGTLLVNRVDTTLCPDIVQNNM